MMTQTLPQNNNNSGPNGASPFPISSASLYVGDLAVEVTEALLFDTFNAVGPVASVRVCRDAATRRSLGYAYVNFLRVEDADRALDTMNYKPIRGRPCRIMWSHRDPTLRRSGQGNVFVNNLAKTVDNKQLYDAFSIFGNILSCKVAMNNKDESLGYGFVHFETSDAAEQAIAKGELRIGEEFVTVQPFKSRKERGTANASSSTNFTNVFVKNLPLDTTTDSLRQLFSPIGAIQNISDVKPATDAKTGSTSTAFAFVSFENAEDAAKAVEQLNNSDFGGKKLYVGRAQKRDERERELHEKHEQMKVDLMNKYAGVNLYVKNLTDDVDDARLNNEFSKYGIISSAKVMRDPTTNKSRGFGFVCFNSPEEATKAVTEANSKMLDGKPLYVALAQRKDVRRAHLEQQHATRGKPFAAPAMMPYGIPPQYNMLSAGGYGRPGMPFYPNMMMPAPHQQVRPGQPRQPYPQQQHPGQPHQPQLMNRMLPQQVNYSLMPVVGQNGQRGHPSQPGVMMSPQQHPQQFQQQNRPRQQQQNGQPQRLRQQGGGRGPHSPQLGNRQPQNDVPQPNVNEPLTIKALAAAPEELKKQMIGERLFPLIKIQEPALAGKITGMLLEMDNGELIHLLESQAALQEKIQEALAVLKQAGIFDDQEQDEQ